MIELFVSKYGYDPRDLEDPSTDEQWLQFRCDQVTEVANEIAEVVHSYGKVMAASPFPTPKMARSMVRQDWGKWNLDIVFPMVYYNYYTSDVSFISDCTIENVRDKNPMTTLYCGMSGVNGPEMFDCMDAALNNGAEGIAIFTVKSLRTPELRAQFKAYTDSVRTLRATTKINPKATGRTVVNLNPFENEGIMQVVQKRMKTFIEEDGAANLLLSEYKLVDEYGTTKCYQVTDEQTKIVFDVKFYFYGGIISGWSVEPEKTSYEQFKKEIKS
jgi:hypothetical protein